jgi:hypothetical protein
MLSVIRLTVLLLSVLMLSVLMQSVFILSVLMLSDVMLSIVMLNVGAGVIRRPPSRRQVYWSTVNSSTGLAKLSTGRKCQLVDRVSLTVNWSTLPTGRQA